MDKNEFPACILPDIEMYGGDTVPWVVTLVRKDGSKYTMDSVEGLRCTLTVTPFKVTTGLGGHAVPIAPLLTKEGIFKEALDGSATVLFDFLVEDTIQLRGKFTYQVDVVYGDDLRAAQGHLYIKQNINRSINY